MCDYTYIHKCRNNFSGKLALFTLITTVVYSENCVFKHRLLHRWTSTERAGPLFHTLPSSDTTMGHTRGHSYACGLLVGILSTQVLIFPFSVVCFETCVIFLLANKKKRLLGCGSFVRGRKRNKVDSRPFMYYILEEEE